MKISVVNSSKIDLGDRIDAEYFEPSYLANENRLKKVNGKPLSDYCTLISSAFYPAATDLYTIGEIPFIRCVDCIEYPAITSLQDETFEKLPRFFIKDNKTIKLLKNEDIVITKVGTPCYASIIHDIQEVALSRTVLGLYNINGIDPFYLTIYLRSKYGYDQLFRERELTIQYQLTLDRVGRILIYKPTNETFEKQIRKVFLESQRLSWQAIAQFKESEQILLFELGLSGWKPNHQLSYIKNFSDTQSFNRIDAEYFQPKYDDLTEKILQYKPGYKIAGDCLVIKDRNVIPRNDEIYKYIELANISTNGDISGFIEAAGKELPTRARLRVNTGDVIVSSIEGSLSSVALISNDFDNALCSTGFYVVSSKIINSETLLVFLKSFAGQLQLKKGCSGTILTAINKDEFKRVLVPNISKSIQDAIKQNISEMYKAKLSSKTLLEIAKRGVEIAIEDNEDEAQKWLNKEVQKSCLTYI